MGRFSDVVCFRGDVTVMCQSDHAAVQLFEAKTSSGYRVFNTVFVLFFFIVPLSD